MGAHARTLTSFKLRLIELRMWIIFPSLIVLRLGKDLMSSLGREAKASVKAASGKVS